MAARAGATYVSPFLGRLDDISTSGVELIRTISDMFAVAGIETEIIAASVRHSMHVTDCALAGADIATVPYKVIEQMLHHPLTDAGIEKFKKDYIAVFGELSRLADLSSSAIMTWKIRFWIFIVYQEEKNEQVRTSEDG